MKRNFGKNTKIMRKKSKEKIYTHISSGPMVRGMQYNTYVHVKKHGVSPKGEKHNFVQRYEIKAHSIFFFQKISVK